MKTIDVLSVICARAGSKGLRNKCIKKINGKMLIEYAIEYSLSLPNRVKTVVSTDIEEIMDYCRGHNVDYIKRDPGMCADSSRIEDALADAIEKKGKDCDYCSLVYGNIPTRYPRLFNEALSFLTNNNDYDAAISMQETGKYHPDWMFDLNREIIPRAKENSYRRQALIPKMIHDGHTVIFRSRQFYLRYKHLVRYDEGYMYSIFGSKIKPLLNDEMIIDIDSQKDFKIAEAIMLNCESGDSAGYR